MIENIQPGGAQIELPIIVWPKRLKLCLSALGALVFVIICQFFIFNSGNDLLVITIGVVGVIFFGSILIYLVYRIIVPRPALVIDEDGIEDNSNMVSVGRVKWNDMQKAWISEVYGQKFISITVADQIKLLSTMNLVKRIVVEKNIQMVGAPINIPQSMVSIPLEQLLRLIQEKIPQILQVSSSAMPTGGFQ